MTDELRTDAFSTSAAPSTLPPAGDARREELKRRTDTLEERAETLAIERNQEAIPHDHDAFNPERNREIQHAISRNYLEIGLNHPYLKVKWVNCRNQDGSMVWAAKSEGWVVATTREFPEAAELSREDGSIRIGDVMLMCIRMDLHAQLEEAQKQKRLRQQYGVEAEIHDLAERTNRRKGSPVFAGVSTPEIGVTGHLSDRAIAAMDARNSRNNAARRVAAAHIGNRMRNAIPEVPLK